MHYETRTFTLCLASPSFLGNAQQEAQWRTPPIKALLRQWWRVEWMRREQYPSDIRAMREAEGLLFGHAWLKGHPGGDARKSRILLRLNPAMPSSNPEDAWGTGQQRGVGNMEKSIDTSYAWYGLDGVGKKVRVRNALHAEEHGSDGPAARTVPEAWRDLRIAASSGDWDDLEKAMKLIAMFGTLGSGARRGWGSVEIPAILALTADELSGYVQTLEQCLRRDWAGALAGDDRGPCVWTSVAEYSGWEDAMAHVARLRRGLRQGLAGHQRKILGMPITSGPGKTNERFAGPLRWKLFKSEKGVSFRAFAMPHAIPASTRERMGTDEMGAAWHTVIDALDKDAALHRSVNKPRVNK